MRIHHVSIPAHDPKRVAAVLAEVLGARVIPLPHPEGTLLVYAGDADGTAIEIWPAATRISEDGRDLAQRDLPLPEAWPHHCYISSDTCDAEAVLAAFAREGWWAEKMVSGPPGGGGFTLVRGLIENHAGIEIVGTEMRAEYEGFFARLVNRRTEAVDTSSSRPRH